jgi:hypothetical protein
MHFNPGMNDMTAPMKQFIWRSFVKGVFIGLGATLGVSIVLTLATYIIAQLKVVPVLNRVIIESQIERYLDEER